MLSGLIVDPARCTKPRLHARSYRRRSVMMGRAPALGRQRAHDASTPPAAMRSPAASPLLDTLLRRPAIASALPRDRLAALCEPSNYLGTAGAMVDRVLARHIKR